MELQTIEQNVIVQAFQTQGGTDALFDRIAEQARSLVPDVTTTKGRDAIGSLAAKVSSSKKLAEKYAIELVADQKAKIKVVDTDRIQFCKKMDSLRDEILAPRVAYVEAENNRTAKHRGAIFGIKHSATLCTLDRSSHEIKQFISNLENLEIDSSFEEYEQEAKLAKLETLEALRADLANREKYEAEQAELERLRQAEQVRIQQERDAQIAREAAEKANREAEEKARFESERVQREKAESEQREARLVAEKEAAVLREEALKRKAIDDAKQADIDKQQAIEAERQRIEQQQAAQAKADREAQEARLANREHMRQINNEILNKLCEIGLDEGQAKAVISAIAKNQVQHVSIKY